MRVRCEKCGDESTAYTPAARIRGLGRLIREAQAHLDAQNARGERTQVPQAQGILLAAVALYVDGVCTQHHGPEMTACRGRLRRVSGR